MVERRSPTTLGDYEFKITTNHFGGELDMNLKVRIGGQVISIVQPEFSVLPGVINTIISNTGIGVNNVRSTINFRLFQDKLNNFDSPVIMKRIENIVFDTNYFNVVENIEMLDNNGNYKLEVVSAGGVG